MALHDIRITASWYPPTAEGSLYATDTPPEHIGGIVVIGRGGFQTTVAIDEPTRFTIRADGHDPLTFTLDPSMTSAVISEGSRMFPGPASFEVSFHYPTLAEAWDRMPMSSQPFIPPRPFVRPSGDLTGTIPLDQHTVSERARRYQRILLGLGFNVGPQGADGRWWTNSANAAQAWARWYNTLPEGPVPSPEDIANGVRLTRGPLVTVSRDMTTEKQTALDRFASRASDQLSDLQVQRTTIVAPPAPVQTPWLAIAGGVVAVTTLVAFVSYANRHANRRSATA